MIFARSLRRAARLFTWPAAALVPLTTSAALACTTMVLGLPDRPLVAYSFDFDATGAGFLVVNPGDAARRSIMDDRPAQWPVRHASVTFNQIGPGMPAAGMNTAGLVVSLMWNSQAAYRSDAQSPVVNELEFIQRLLDTTGSVEEALDTLPEIAIEGMVPIHYLLADRFGKTAAILPTPAGFATHRGEGMPVPALTNTSYSELLERLADFEGFGGNRPVPTGDRSEDPDSLRRFAVGASASRRAGSTIDSALDTLGDVANRETRWQIVFDPLAQRIVFRIRGRNAVHLLDMATLDLGCSDRPLSVDLNAVTSRDVSEALAPLEPVRAAAVARTVLGSFSGTADFPPEIADGLIMGLLDAVNCER
ncbi:MAG: carcinine hydrolase/isopenicillin-N N-acyltransferase family protein [Alphaproteobacteria bacterium]|nr:carcinine hydrolase/isopenicillin-N N-acyltransferase family protein [Alphaproteobacteria bacterium]